MKNNVVIEITYYVSVLRIIGMVFNRGHYRADGEEFLSRKLSTGNYYDLDSIQIYILSI
ncbi:hypothetical protein bcgnr5380_45380 [Bacillus cereus]